MHNHTVWKISKWILMVKKKKKGAGVDKKRWKCLLCFVRETKRCKMQNSTETHLCLFKSFCPPETGINKSLRCHFGCLSSPWVARLQEGFLNGYPLGIPAGRSLCRWQLLPLLHFKMSQYMVRACDMLWYHTKRQKDIDFSTFQLLAAQRQT